MIDYKKLCQDLKAENRRLKLALDRATWGSCNLADRLADQRRQLEAFRGRQTTWHAAMAEALGVEPRGKVFPLEYVLGVFKSAAAIEPTLSMADKDGSALFWDSIDDLRTAVKVAQNVVK